MVRTLWFMALCGSITLALASQAAAGDETSLRAEVDCLKAQIAQIQNSKHETWLNEQRSGHLKALIHEVLADADTRATLLQDGLSAGHDGEHFFLKSADGNNLLQLGGQVQLRGNWDSQDNRADEDEFGLQISRAKLWFSGHAGTPRLTYFVRLAALDASPVTSVAFGLFQDVIVSYELADGLSLSAGHFPLPFLREELTSSENQLAVERSATNEFFTLNRASQIQADLQGDGYRLRGAFSDGANSGYTTAGADAVEIALTGRVDLKIAGDWDQMNDFTAWGGEDFAAFVGAAVHHEEGDADNGAVSDYLGWTVDGSVETGGVGVFAALSGGTVETPGAADRDMWGLVLQAGLNLNDTIEPFVRWETIDPDTGSEPESLTVGFNWFFDGHNSKLTTDLVWVYDGAAPAANPFGAAPFGPNSGVSAFATADNDDLVVVRTQYQLLF
jgi:hypothetical protein